MFGLTQYVATPNSFHADLQIICAFLGTWTAAQIFSLKCKINCQKANLAIFEENCVSEGQFSTIWKSRHLLRQNIKTKIAWIFLELKFYLGTRFPWSTTSCRYACHVELGCGDVSNLIFSKMWLSREEVVMVGPLVHIVLGPVLALLHPGGGEQPPWGPYSWWYSL